MKNILIRIQSIMILIAFMLQITSTNAIATTDIGQQSIKGKVVMVVVDGLNLDDVKNPSFQTINWLMQQGSLGVMTTNPASGFPRTPSNTYATIGAGAKVSGGKLGGQAYNRSEKTSTGIAANVFTRYTGLKAPAGEVIHLGIQAMSRDNSTLKYDAKAGTIGEMLKQNGYATGVVGNGDYKDDSTGQLIPTRYGVTIAMDESGQVTYGDVSEKCVKSDISSVAGMATNYPYMKRVFSELLKKCSFIVCDTGDTYRVNKYRNEISDQSYNRQKQLALRKVDTFIHDILPLIDLKKDLLIVVSPTPSNIDIKNGLMLTPAIIAGGDFKQGLLTSGSTRGKGFVSNVDLAPTILNHFKLPSNNTIIGQSIVSISSKESVSTVSDFMKRAVLVTNLRYGVTKTYINGALALLVISLIVLITRPKWVNKVKFLWLGFYFIPLAFFIPVRLFSTVLTGEGIYIIAFGVLATLLLTMISIQSGLNPFMVASGLSFSVMTLDLWFGSYFNQASPLSYDVMGGARYYGMGNEIMGFTIGYAIVFLGLLLDRFKGNKKIQNSSLFITGFVAYSIAAPQLGANVGGAIAAVFGLGTALCIVYGRKPDMRTVFTVSLATCMALAIMITYESTKTIETQTHLGRAIGLIRTTGITAIMDIIVRKMQINIKLIRYTTWSWFCFSGLLFLAVSRQTFKGLFNQVLEENPWFIKILPSVIIGSVAALIFNDSGVVAAANSVFTAFVPLSFFLINQMRKELN